MNCKPSDHDVNMSAVVGQFCHYVFGRDLRQLLVRFDPCIVVQVFANISTVLFILRLCSERKVHSA